MMRNIFSFESRDDKLLDGFVERNREPALIIIADDAGPNGRGVSKFGGIPLLPKSFDWPRDSKGDRLHFLAQIDCAELPWHGRLPDTGVLSFFGRDDEEQI